VSRMKERPPWDFDYGPIAAGGTDQGQPSADLIVATTEDVDAVDVTEALGGLAPDVAVTPLFSSHPIFWTRIEASIELDQAEVQRRLGSSRVRYVASAAYGSQRLPPPLDFTDARPRYPRDWGVRPPTAVAEVDTPWRWFLRPEGADVCREHCGTGAGTRLAVIDNDGRDLHQVGLEAEIPVGVASIPRAHSHAALLIGWAVGARLAKAAFRGIAPDASPRVYCVPKPGGDVWTLPLALARAVEDGADVVVCATYLEGQSSPMLDDALELAARAGRGGRGTLVVMPTGREMSSPPGTMHSSLSLGLSEPAADPRVICVGPSARDTGWFLWRDRLGRLRPFANRGPAVRFLAPGDDLAHPFSEEDRPWHAESSGAAGVASGVMLLVVANNPDLTAREIEQLLRETALPPTPTGRTEEPSLADESDMLPTGRDDDGHDAKHGYGRMSARRACLAAQDPVALTLARMGEYDAARVYLDARRAGAVHEGYSRALSLWAVRRLLCDGRLAHAAASVLRALRLWSAHPERLKQQPPGQVLRQLGLIVRLLNDGPIDSARRDELVGLELSLRAVQAGGRAAEVEQALAVCFGASAAWSGPDAGIGENPSPFMSVQDGGVASPPGARVRMGSA
jgi:hypothetical protein